MARDNTQGSGSSEDFGTNRQEQPVDRLNQVIRNFHTKAALIILHSRVNLRPAYSKGTDTRRVNKWFNIEMDETEDYKDEIRPWKLCDLRADRPPPMTIEIFISMEHLQPGQRLVLLDEEGKRWDVKSVVEAFSEDDTSKRRVSSDNEVVLERWNIELGEQATELPSDMGTLLPIVYKKSIVLFRSLFTYCNFLPAYKLSRKVNRGRSSGSLKLNYRLIASRPASSRSQVDSIKLPLYDSSASVSSEYMFGVTESPAGPFSVSVTYRQNCDFQIDSSEEIISRQLLASDDDIFQPSLPQDVSHEPSKAPIAHEVGSLPTDHRRNLIQRPDLGQAYGSLSTFHQAGLGARADPMSVLRNAQDYGADSPSPPQAQGLGLPQQSSNESSRTSLRPALDPGRRSSFSFNPFKAPALSVSPLTASPLAPSPRPATGRPPTLSSLAEERGTQPMNMRAHIARKSISLAPEQAVLSLVSTSPRPSSVPKYSSSFSHRRARLSAAGINRTDDEQNSSGRGSAASSAQASSGLVVEQTGGQGSSESMQDDDESLNSFLNLLETNRGLLTPSDAATNEASTKRTTAALMRFHKMRDSNAALSDSMSSSVMGHRSSSSSSRQLSSVPPMIAATSFSTSSSPGKPISPHTPHTPFAPSRLSAAYSHDETTRERLPLIEEPPSPSEADTSGSTTRGESTTSVPPIEIPNSPRRYLTGYRRSSSARRDNLAPDDDITELYGLRPQSMGSRDQRVLRRAQEPNPPPAPTTASAVDSPADADGEADAIRPSTTKPPPSVRHVAVIVENTQSSDGNVDFSSTATGANPSSSSDAYRSRLTRGGGIGSGGPARGMNMTPLPAQGSTSSLGGGTGNSTTNLDRDGQNSAGGSTTSGSWGRGINISSAGIGAGGRGSRGSGGSGSGGGGGSASGSAGAGGGGGRRTGSRPDNRFDDDEFLFALDKSDFATGNKGLGGGGNGSGGAGSSSGRGGGGGRSSKRNSRGME